MNVDTVNCQCEELDDELIESGWTCYNCYEQGND